MSLSTPVSQVSDLTIRELLIELDNVSPIDLIHEMVTDDPFFAVRACIDIARQDEDEFLPHLHSIPMRKDLLKDQVPSMLGLNCYLPDNMIEGRPAQIEAAKKMEDLLILLGELPPAAILERT